MGVVIMWWVWIECRGVVSGCSYNEVYIILIIIIDFLIVIYYLCLYSTCISSFLPQHPYFFVHFKNVFCLYIFYEKNE